jgi:ADP-ribose pyrophosphatase
MERLESKTVFEGRVVRLADRRYRRANGNEVERQVVEHPGAVGIVAHDAEFVYLVRQPREAVEDDALLELPAGMLDVEEESEQACAERELAEEVGLRAARWRRMRSIFTSPGWADERLTLFEATGLSAAEAEADDEEEIEIVRLPLAEIDSALERIEDAKTVIGLLLLSERLRSGSTS